MSRPLATALALALATAGCASQPRIAIRPVGERLLKPMPVNALVAQGRAELVLGHVALALESFRRAARQDPRDIAAYLGLAAGFERMGRFDLTRRYLEQALAIEPGNLDILGAMASALERQGLTRDAAAVRAEIALRAAGERSADAWESALAEDDRTRTERVAVEVLAEPSPAPPRPAAPAGPPAPVADLPRGPRLVRFSLGEVALITSPGPTWTAPEAAFRRQTASVPALRRDTIALLNAARVARLAARTRQMLAGDGWSRLAIGDAPRVREHSLILYPAERRAEAERLAARLGAAHRLDPHAARITVLLGRDRAVPGRPRRG